MVYPRRVIAGEQNNSAIYADDYNYAPLNVTGIYAAGGELRLLGTAPCMAEEFSAKLKSPIYRNAPV